jgi:hypothetical protein
MGNAKVRGNGPRTRRQSVRLANVTFDLKGGPEQVFLIFTVVPQIFSSQNAKRRKIAEKMRAATASQPGTIRRAGLSVKERLQVTTSHRI